MPYKIEVTASAERQLRATNKTDRAQLLLHVYQLGLDPRPSNATMIDDENEAYRLNIGRYALVYWVREKSVVVLLIENETTESEGS